MKKVILLGLLLISFVGYSQTTNDDGAVIIEIKNESTDPNQIHTTVEIAAEYPGGIQEFRKFIAQNYRAPKVNHDLKGAVIVTFVVETDGSLTDIKVIRDLGYGTGEEAVRVLKKSKKWKAGLQNGQPVRVRYTQPIHLNIEGNPAVKSEE